MRAKGSFKHIFLTLTGSGWAYLASIDAVLWPLTLAASGIVSSISNSREIVSWRRSWKRKSWISARLMRRRQDCFSVSGFTGKINKSSWCKAAFVINAVFVSGTMRLRPFFDLSSSTNPRPKSILSHLMLKISPSLIDVSQAAIIVDLVRRLLHGVRISRSISSLCTRLCLWLGSFLVWKLLKGFGMSIRHSAWLEPDTCFPAF